MGNFYQTKRNLASKERFVRNSELISERNKDLIFQFQREFNYSKSDTTKINYFVSLHDVAKYFGMDLDLITREDVTNWVNMLFRMKDEGKFGDGEWRVYDIIRHFKTFWYWYVDFYEEDVEKDPETLRRITKVTKRVKKIRLRKPRRKVGPGEIISPEEADRLLKAAGMYGFHKWERAENQALIAVASDKGLRPGEWGDLRISDIKRDSKGLFATVGGKMEGRIGKRKVRLVRCVPYLEKWLELHPHRNDRSAPLWVNRQGKQMSYFSAWKRLKKILSIHNEEHPESPIDKRLFWRLFRYKTAKEYGRKEKEGAISRETWEKDFGWVKGSKQPNFYAPLDDDERDSEILDAFTGGNLEETLHTALEEREDDILSLKEEVYLEIISTQKQRFDDMVKRQAILEEKLKTLQVTA